MSRDEGFDVMDVSTSLPNDPKFRGLAREYPDVLAAAFYAYVATMAESWKAGERVTVDVAWPPILPHDDRAVTAMQAVKLLDAKGRVTVSAWRGYFEQARVRREKSRERWRRANAVRHGETPKPNGHHLDAAALLPRGSDAVTAPPSDSDSVRPIPSDSKDSRDRQQQNGRAPADDPATEPESAWVDATAIRP